MPFWDSPVRTGAEGEISIDNVSITLLTPDAGGSLRSAVDQGPAMPMLCSAGILLRLLRLGNPTFARQGLIHTESHDESRQHREGHASIPSR